MHYYQHNIKEFNNATRHLTRVERSLYRDSIELYYGEESPLPADFNALSRRLIANTEEEKDALKYVLDEFFYLDGDVYRQDRCEEDISTYHANSSAKARAGRASAEAKRLKREAGKQRNLTPDEQVLDECSTGGQQNSTNQEPLTINQEPIEIQNTYVNGDAVDASEGKSQEAKPKEKMPDCPHGKIVDLYHEHCPSFAGVKILSDTRKKTLLARWRSDPKHQTLEFWETYFAYAATSAFLRGETKEGWKADFDFLINSSKFISVIEGKYHHEARH